MAMTRKRPTSQRDPRKRNPGLRETLRKKVFACSDVCGICGRPVDKTLPAGHPLAPELDEIVPIARGGSALDIDNLQLVHRRCNEKKGARMIGDVNLKTIKDPLPISREW